jgi:hypothetical protein
METSVGGHPTNSRRLALTPHAKALRVPKWSEKNVSGNRAEQETNGAGTAA